MLVVTGQAVLRNHLHQLTKMTKYRDTTDGFESLNRWSKHNARALRVGLEVEVAMH
jgi:hypothetical protein